MSQQLSDFRFLFFFFSSRRRHTRLQGDWSSDVCSSDLFLAYVVNRINFITQAMSGQTSSKQTPAEVERLLWRIGLCPDLDVKNWAYAERSEERRVGKSVDLGGRRIIKKKKKIKKVEECE